MSVPWFPPCHYHSKYNPDETLRNRREMTVAHLLGNFDDSIFTGKIYIFSLTVIS